MEGVIDGWLWDDGLLAASLVAAVVHIPAFVAFAHQHRAAMAAGEHPAEQEIVIPRLGARHSSLHHRLDTIKEFLGNERGVFALEDLA